MTDYSAQGSITVKRLRNGDSLFLTLENNGIPLYQSIDPNSGAVSPDWTKTENQPIITPKANSVRGNKVVLSGHNWYYNNNTVPLMFNGEVSGDWVTDSTGTFALNNVTGALKIIKNLASKDNTANDNLKYTAIARVSGVEYNVGKSVDILIQPSGASSYIGFVIASTTQLTSIVTSANLSTQLQVADKQISDYHVKWYKDDTEWVINRGKKTITVGREDVDGEQLFIAEFYLSSEDANPVYRAGIRVIDTLDDFMIVLTITSANKEVDTGSPVTVSGKIINSRTNAEVEYNAKKQNWALSVWDTSTWQVIKTSNTNSIEVTTTETDRDNQERDVEVTAECNWTD